jgi:hypothetical protein
VRALQRGLIAITCLLLAGCAHLFPVEAGEDLPDFAAQAPAPGQPAPDPLVHDLDGRAVALSALFGRRPVVLQLGSHTCPVYRYRRFDMAGLQEEFAGQVDFVVLYTQEAHPAGSAGPYRDGEWLTWINRVTDTRLDQPASLDARRARAAWSARTLRRQDRIVVDAMDNHGWRSFGAAPSAAFVVDREGRIVLTQPWVEPQGLRRALRRLLSASNAVPDQPGRAPAVP